MCKPTVTLYISYDSWYDVLYLSDSGYGPDEAWQTLPGLVRGRWGRVPIYLFLGAKTENLRIGSGEAYVDNFVIEKGKIGSPYPSTDPTQPPGGGGEVLDVAATVAIMPSVVKRAGLGRQNRRTGRACRRKSPWPTGTRRMCRRYRPAA